MATRHFLAHLFEFGRAQAMDVVAGQCILMFLEPVGWTHRIHRELKKAAGRLPT